MAATGTMTNQCKQDLLNSLSGHTIKLALYTTYAGLSASTTEYTTTNEISGTGYTAGGISLTGFSVSLDENQANVDFADTSWTGNISCAAAILYDETNSNKTLSVFDLDGTQTVTGATLTAIISAGILGIA